MHVRTSDVWRMRSVPHIAVERLVVECDTVPCVNRVWVLPIAIEMGVRTELRVYMCSGWVGSE